MTKYIIQYRWRKDPDWITPLADLSSPDREYLESRVQSLTETFGDWKFQFRVVEAANSERNAQILNQVDAILDKVLA